MKYDPLVPPNPEQWLALDEGQQISIVEQYHGSRRIKLPNPTLHAVIHTVVETQVAMGDALPVARTLQRLITEGLDRHEAVHAIGAMLASHMDALQAGDLPAGIDANEIYYDQLRSLTKESWLDQWK
jgi:hypothetical protein